MNRGIVAPAEEIGLAVPYLRSFAPPVESSPVRPAPARLAALPEGEQTRAREQIDRAIADAVNPALERLASFVDGPYRAKAPAAVGLSQYSGGRAYYQYLIRRHTSVPWTPGSMRSSTTTSGLDSSTTRRPDGPSSASRTSWPSASSTTFTILRTSS